MSSLDTKPIRILSREETQVFSSCWNSWWFHCEPRLRTAGLSQSTVPELTELESVGSLLETQTLWSHSRPPKFKNPRVGPSNLYLNKLSKWIWFMVKFKNCWLGIFLTLLCILAASYLSRVRSDLHQVPRLGLPPYCSVQLEIICWHACHPRQSWSKPHSHSRWHRVGTNACLVNWCWSTKWRNQPWWFMGFPWATFASIGMPFRSILCCVSSCPVMGIW